MAFWTKQDLNQFKVYFNDFNQVDINSISFSDIGQEFDSYHFFEKGDLYQYLIEPFKENQPKTYQWLMTGEFFYFIEKFDEEYQMNDITKFGIIVNDLVCYIKYTNYPYELYPKNNHIPKEINASWLYRSDRWDIAEESTLDIYQCALPRESNPSLTFLIDIKKNKKHYFEFMSEKFNKKLRTYEDNVDELDNQQYFDLRCFIDTRGLDNFGQKGYQILTSSYTDDNEDLFVIKNADYTTIKRLEHSAAVIDEYAAHVFKNRNTDFDFMKYAVDF